MDHFSCNNKVTFTTLDAHFCFSDQYRLQLHAWPLGKDFDSQAQKPANLFKGKVTNNTLVGQVHRDHRTVHQRQRSIHVELGPAINLKDGDWASNPSKLTLLTGTKPQSFEKNFFQKERERERERHRSTESPNGCGEDHRGGAIHQAMQIQPFTSPRPFPCLLQVVSPKVLWIHTHILALISTMDSFFDSPLGISLFEAWELESRYNQKRCVSILLLLWFRNLNFYCSVSTPSAGAMFWNFLVFSRWFVDFCESWSCCYVL